MRAAQEELPASSASIGTPHGHESLSDEAVLAHLCHTIDDLLRQRLDEQSLRLERSLAMREADVKRAMVGARGCGVIATGTGVKHEWSQATEGFRTAPPLKSKSKFGPVVATETNISMPDPIESVLIGQTRTSVPWQGKGRPEQKPNSLQRLVRGFNFELFWSLIIFSNAIFVGVHAHVSATSGISNTEAWTAVKYAYSCAFLVELIMRLLAQGKGFFLDHGCEWNYFDLVIVVSSTIEMMVELVAREMDTSENRKPPSASSMRVIRILRITRIVRIIRMVRIVRFVSALRTLIYSIIGTLRSLVWAIILLALIIYVFGVIFTQAIADHVLSNSPSSVAVYREHWGGLPTSMLTLFQSVSNGVSWKQAITPLLLVGWPWSALFLFYICFASLAVMNVVTGVFCQSAIEGANRDQELLIHQQVSNRNMFTARLQQLFESIDEDGAGFITVHHLEEYLTDASMQAYFSALELDTSDALSFFKLLDSDGDSQYIDCEDFVMGCTRLKGSAKAIHLAQLIQENKRMRRRLAHFMNTVEHTLHDLAVGTQLPPGSESSDVPRVTLGARRGSSGGSVRSVDTRASRASYDVIPEAHMARGGSLMDCSLARGGSFIDTTARSGSFMDTNLSGGLWGLSEGNSAPTLNRRGSGRALDSRGSGLQPRRGSLGDISGMASSDSQTASQSTRPRRSSSGMVFGTSGTLPASLAMPRRKSDPGDVPGMVSMILEDQHAEADDIGAETSQRPNAAAADADEEASLSSNSGGLGGSTCDSPSAS